MARNVWVNETVASRLIGLNAGLVCKRARKGKYGPVRPGLKPKEILISTRGLAMAARRDISPLQIKAAQADQPFPPEFGDGLIHKRLPKYSIDEIGAAVVRNLEN
jgi:hypothetical protein